MGTLIMAAAYLHVPPWELADRPTVWRDWALTVMAAQQAAENERMAAMMGARGK